MNCDIDLCTVDPDLCLTDPDYQELGYEGMTTKRSYRIGDNDSKLMYSYNAIDPIAHQLVERVTKNMAPLMFAKHVGSSSMFNLFLFATQESPLTHRNAYHNHHNDLNYLGLC